jgi:hypothetical protein
MKKSFTTEIIEHAENSNRKFLVADLLSVFSAYSVVKGLR